MAALVAGRGRGADKGVLGIAPKAMILPIQIAPTSTSAADLAFSARVPRVVAVGAVDHNGERAARPELTLVAPGADITAVDADGEARTATGASDANALVAGAVALIRAKYPQLKGPTWFAGSP
ncbi:S8 family serine peptidase [Dactylosporangium sp. NPDC049140]|uniref:S8 family serine peptidase n=1 Tax=Dactylosporangium sp. NPDC049140 TaxID=3155647 RepID=UPI0033F06ECF